MSTVRVWLAVPSGIIEAESTDARNSGFTIPVVRLSDLDALREGLEEIQRVATHGQGSTVAVFDWLMTCREEARRLLAMLPKEGA